MKTSFFILVLIVVCSSEPHCSKYHYEEKTLEKMIRTEILVATMKKQMYEIEARVTGALTKLNEERITWKGEIETLQEENKENFAKLQEAKSDLEKNVQIVQDLKGKLLAPNIAFNAKNVKDTTARNGRTIVFPDILLNLGEAYNSDTGVFTVPYDGIYLFTVQLCIYNIQVINFGLVVDNVYMDKAKYHIKESFTRCNELVTTGSLKSGNKVWVVHQVIGSCITMMVPFGHHSPEFLFDQIDSSRSRLETNKT